MLHAIEPAQAHRIADLARAARAARDDMLHGVADEVEGTHPAKGEQDRHAPASFDESSAADRSLSTLWAEIGRLQPAARSELFVLMRVGQGELAPKDWERGLSEADVLGDETVRGLLAEDIDLQSHLDKGLYEVTHSPR